MDQAKVQQILNWPPPRNLKPLQSFLGFANFYHCFIKNYSKKISSLTSFLKKDPCFPLNEEALNQFHQLKEAFTTAPILSHFNPSLPTIVETNASDHALAAVLSQVYDSGKHPIAFNSRKLIPEELNYKIHDKELLGIVWALKRWRSFLISLSSPFEVLTDHSSLQYFMSSKVLTRHQAHWAEFLSKFHFSITYWPGCLATIPDPLSLWDDVYLERGEDFISKNPMNLQQIIKQDEVQPSKFFAVKVESFSNLIDSIQKKLWQDPQYRSILEDLGKGKSVQDYSLDSSSQLLLFKDWVVVPNDSTIQLSILQKRHDSPLAGHPGQEKTLKLVKWDFHWSGMTQFIKDYVSSCQQCSRNKNIHHKKFGFLKPLPIPNVIVDRFSKMAGFIPTMYSITSLDLAHLFIKNIFSKHGLPSSIVSDRGSLFVSSFWTNLCQQLKISRDLSTAYHPETDGQTERVNQILEQYLRMYVSYHQDDWNTWLPLAEFAYNNSDHYSTNQSPFFTFYGRDPQFDSVHITQDTPAGKLSTKVQSVQQAVKRELEASINWFKRYADKGRASPPVFNPGDMKVSSHAYHLKLPSQWKSVHPVFHISLLEPVNTSTIPNRHQEPPPPITIVEGEEWEVSQELDSKLKRRKLWYLVECKGFSQDPERSTWEPAENLKNCPDLVKDFHSLYPDKKGPNYSKDLSFMVLGGERNYQR
ncbi:hypothetical protein O181_105700 [Austropuccinia psidii MF-1]|uniref:Integrase catalytic domain-containing protein n=1 Tax=Austropuccinia psidii MF-1 TaxID=1389203 RepID=A0A9Q3PLW4_9BASI|nr:hypothetical protein [Austropuccinia psidii MF-1]